MRRVFISVFLAVCVFAQAAFCVSEEAFTPDRHYAFDITVLPAQQALLVRQTLVYENRTGDALDRLIFSVPANCFRRESTLPYDNAALEKAFPNGYAPGGMDLSLVRVNGRDAEWAVQGANECFLRVSCSAQPMETLTVELEFTLLLTDNCAFLGSGEMEWRLSQFYPSLCVYDAGEYVTNALSRAGEWRYAPCADFDARVFMPADYEIAVSGHILKDAVSSFGVREVDVSLSDARDFAFAVSRRFHASSAFTARGTQICVYGQDRALMKDVLSEAVDVLDVLENWFGALPYGRVALVQSQSAADVSGSGIVFLTADAAESRLGALLCRQYFQELVHVDPALEPWLYEGVSLYVSLLVQRELHGEATFARAVDRALRPALQITVPGGYTVNAYAYLFSTQREYEIIVRERGAAVLHELAKGLGYDGLLSALKIYVGENRLRIASVADFSAALEKAFGENRDDALFSWLYTIDDYTKETIEFYD